MNRERLRAEIDKDKLIELLEQKIRDSHKVSESDEQEQTERLQKFELGRRTAFTEVIHHLKDAQPNAYRKRDDES